ncbi:MAG: alanine racemase [Gemmatimonadaceae bacterium]|nr:alanine racemase [Gemmatimonadaceae bacterium]
MSHSPTPAILIDLPTVKRNIARLAEYGRAHNIGIRPHTKTHKSIRMAQLQLQAGAVGLTTAKVSEAITMGEAGDDLLIAFPALDGWRAEHLAKLAKTRTVRVAVDSTYAADSIAGAARAAGVTVGILVDLDVGLHRTGVQSPTDALQLAQHVARTSGVRLDGIMCYPGHIKVAIPDQPPVLSPVSQILAQTLDLWRRAGLQAAIVSGGSSPTAYQSHLIPQITEIRPGTYIYNDMSMVSCGHATLQECAARVVCTVVSTAVPGKFVIDAGSKTLTQDRRAKDPDTAGFGYVIEYPFALIARLTEEHGEVDARHCDRLPRLGQRLHVIPNHICPCVNLHSTAWVTHDDGRTDPMPVDARGQVW